MMGMEKHIDWLKGINTLETEGSYNITMATVKAYNGLKYFSTVSDTVVKKIDDSFGEVSAKCSNDVMVNFFLEKWLESNHFRSFGVAFFAKLR